MGQEMYLQHMQQQQQQERQKQLQQENKSQRIEGTSAAGPPATNSNPAGGYKEMPEDLLKFIQDVGPAERSVDREFTATRLLEKENQEELDKAESVRTAKRERVRMPLIQGDKSFTTEKNTNFAIRDESKSASAGKKHDFGLSNLLLYEFLIQKDDIADRIEIVGNFHEKILSDSEEDRPNYLSPEGEELKKKELELLSQTLNALEVPKLRINSDGDVLGLYSKDVPGPEMTSISTIPESKIKLVLKDLSTTSPGSYADTSTLKSKELPSE
jgi:hypothetical protein